MTNMTNDSNQLLIILKRNLSTIFGNSTLRVELSKNVEFRNVIAKQIGICNNLENINNLQNTDRLTNKYVNNFKNITNQNIELLNYQFITNLDDILDEINYVNVMIKNIFNKTIDDFKINTNNDVILDDMITNIDNSSENNEQQKSQSNDFIQPLQGERISAAEFASPNDKQTYSSINSDPFFNQRMNMSNNTMDQIYRGIAVQRVNMEIEIGKIYR